MKNGFFVILASVVFSACNSGTASQNSQKTTVSTDTPSVQTAAIDSAAREIYSGVLPCIDCSGIETRLSLKSDSTFEKSVTYMGIRDSTVAVAPLKGRWTLHADTVELLMTTAPNRFVRRDTQLLQLDLLGRPTLSKKGDTLTLNRISQ